MYADAQATVLTQVHNACRGNAIRGVIDGRWVWLDGGRLHGGQGDGGEMCVRRAKVEMARERNLCRGNTRYCVGNVWVMRRGDAASRYARHVYACADMKERSTDSTVVR